MTLKPGHDALRTHVCRAEPQDDLMRFVASTDSVDRYSTRILQFWKLDNFMRNPVFLWGHDSRSKPVGRVESFDIAPHQSVATVRFAPTAEGEELHKLYAEGFLNAVSVGFRAGSVTYIEDEDVVELGSEEHPNELFELSGATIPGNAEALAEGRASGLTENIDRRLRALFEPIVGRMLEPRDLDLLRAGALPAQLDVLRSIHDRLDSFEALRAGEADSLAEAKRALDTAREERGEPVLILINEQE